MITGQGLSSSSIDALTRAENKMHDQISEEFGFLTVEEVVNLLGIKKPYQGVEEYRDGMIWVNVNWKAMFPRFQFSETGPKPVIKELITLGDKYHRTRSGLVYWMMSPTTYLAGKRPVDVIDDSQTLLNVAESSFGVEW